MREVAVLGAGIAGISAAYHAQLKGLSAKVYEAADSTGGLLDNFIVEGCRFDNAIHLSFTTDQYVRSLFDRVPHHQHLPESWCLYNDYWLKHPAQNNLYPLPLEQKLDLLESMLNEQDQGEIRNYEDWLIKQYGKVFCEKFPLPYTEKYWTVPAAELSTTWVGSRLRKFDVREVLHGAMSSKTQNHYYAKEMRYPKEGGYKGFIEPLISKCDISCNMRAVSLNISAKVLHFEDGTKLHYDKLVSTIPITELVRLSHNVPTNVIEAAKNLWATTIDLISIGFNLPQVTPHLWFYIYDESIPAARAYSPKIKSPSNCPEGKSALQFEIYSSPKKPLGMSIDSLKQSMVDSVVKMGLAELSDILFVHHKRLPFGNVVFDHDMEERRGIVKEFFEGNGISLAGRFGEWDYFWSDQSLLSGKKAIDEFY